MAIDFRKNSRSLGAAWFAVLVFLVFTIITPLLMVILSAKPQDFVFVFKSSILKQTLLNTFFECITSTTLSVVLGYIYAYAVVKANIPFKKFFASIPLLHLMTPPFVGGLAFILLVGRQGIITHKILGLDVSLYGFWGLLIAQSLCFFPMAYLICVQSLKGVNSNLEQAARSMGASNRKIFWTITFPLSSTGIISSFLFVAVNVLSDFGNPLIVGGRFRVLAVEIYTQLTGWTNAGTSAVLGILLIIPSVILFLLQNKLFKNTNLKLSSIGGKDSSKLPEQKNTSAFTSILLTIFVIFISVCVAAQFISIIVGSFQKLWGINTAFTFDHIKAVFTGRYFKGLKNSLLFALIGAAFSTTIACLTSFIVHRTNAPLRKSIDIFSQLPSAIPGSLLGLSISIAANKFHFNYSPVLIVTAMTVSFLPFSYRIITQSFGQIKQTLDDGARSLGASQIKTLTSIIAPLSTGGIFSGFIYDFIRGVGTLSAVIFLVSFDTPLTSINIVNLADQGNWGVSTSLALVLTVISFSTLAIGKLIIYSGQKISKKDGRK